MIGGTHMDFEKFAGKVVSGAKSMLADAEKKNKQTTKQLINDYKTKVNNYEQTHHDAASREKIKNARQQIKAAEDRYNERYGTGKNGR